MGAAALARPVRRHRPGAASGLNWALSIVFLVITARVLLFRLFVKQVHYQRNMQEMQPKIQKLREKYKDDRAELQRQMMKLQQEEGFNPLTGCLPMFLQIPVFLGLYHVLRHLSNSSPRSRGSERGSRPLSLLTLYSFSKDETCQRGPGQAVRRSAGRRPSATPSSTIHALGGDPARRGAC